MKRSEVSESERAVEEELASAAASDDPDQRNVHLNRAAVLAHRCEESRRAADAIGSSATHDFPRQPLFPEAGARYLKADEVVEAIDAALRLADERRLTRVGVHLNEALRAAIDTGTPF